MGGLKPWQSLDSAFDRAGCEERPDGPIRLGLEASAAVAELEALCFSSPWDETRVRAALVDPHFIAYGMFRQGVLAAYIALAVPPGEVEILNIATRPACRRQGHARRLLECAAALMHERGAERIVLEARERNAPAIALYRSAGFERVGLRKAYYADTGEDALIMSLANPDCPA